MHLLAIAHNMQGQLWLVSGAWTPLAMGLACPSKKILNKQYGNGDNGLRWRGYIYVRSVH
jgi:hypothetical protein